MNQDEAFIQAILADPDDEATRLVYADWLDERDDPRGKYLRLQAQLATLPIGQAWRTVKVQLELHSRSLDPDWLARLDRTPVENCDVRFELLCPKQWQQLRPTEDATVRHCDVCKQNVYHCSTMWEAREHAGQGHCVAVDSIQYRTEGDLTSEGGMLVGVLRGPPMPPPLSAGQPVTVLGGKWQGRRGVVASVNQQRGRATVRLRIFGIPWRIEVGLNDLRREGERDARG
jgi:uncharacterized protein (TIGR02996 family)